MPTRAESDSKAFPSAIVALSTIAAFVLRLRFVGAPLSVDETGYLSIARLWNSGTRLYADAWVDRPVGLLLIYRLGVIVHLDQQGPRIVAAIFGALMTFCLARGVHELGFGRIAAGTTAIVFGTLSIAPLLEGFAANGELLGAAPNAVAFG